MPTLAIPGPTELWIIGGLLMLVFGAKKLPELARAMGSSVTQFKKGLKEDPELLEGSPTSASETEPEANDA